VNVEDTTVVPTSIVSAARFRVQARGLVEKSGSSVFGFWPSVGCFTGECIEEDASPMLGFERQGFCCISGVEVRDNWWVFSGEDLLCTFGFLFL
jgi:hypothetical protein